MAHRASGREEERDRHLLVAPGSTGNGAGELRPELLTERLERFDQAAGAAIGAGAGGSSGGNGIGGALRLRGRGTGYSPVSRTHGPAAGGCAGSLPLTVPDALELSRASSAAIVPLVVTPPLALEASSPSVAAIAPLVVTAPLAALVSSDSVALTVPLAVAVPEAAEVSSPSVAATVPVMPPLETVPLAAEVSRASVAPTVPVTVTVPLAALVSSASLAPTVPVVVTVPLALEVSSASVAAIVPVTSSALNVTVSRRLKKESPVAASAALKVSVPVNPPPIVPTLVRKSFTTMRSFSAKKVSALSPAQVSSRADVPISTPSLNDDGPNSVKTPPEY